eukprot:721549-Pyramimonas_sp.AAC.1
MCIRDSCNVVAVAVAHPSRNLNITAGVLSASLPPLRRRLDARVRLDSGRVVFNRRPRRRPRQQRGPSSSPATKR